MVAADLGYRLLDTGAIYRAVAHKARACNIPWDDGAKLGDLARDLAIEFALDGEINHVRVDGLDVTVEIRDPAISQGASKVSAHPEVRDALLTLQRRLAQGGGVVVEGRDTGTVVFPNAEVKVFLTAADEVRARRRVVDLERAGKPSDLATVLAEMRERDGRDASRDVAPMKAASDALWLDSSSMSLPEVVAYLVEFVRKTAAGVLVTVAATVHATPAAVWDAWTNPAHITQWCFATDTWEAPAAHHDVRNGGRFVTTMAAKDRSIQFDFAGTYEMVMPPELLRFRLDDGRSVEVAFRPDGNTVQVIERFAAEATNPVEMQKAGWQAILNNFKQYVEQRYQRA